MEEESKRREAGKESPRRAIEAKKAYKKAVLMIHEDLTNGTGIGRS